MSDNDPAMTARLPSFRVDGQVALVTGAGAGLGAGIAIGLAEAGADVVLIARRKPALDQVAARIEGLGRRATVAVCDVTRSDELRSVVAGLGRLDILVNNAGTNFPEPFVDVSDAHLDAMLDLNVRAAFVAAQAAARKMLEDPARAKKAAPSSTSPRRWGTWARPTARSTA